MEILESATLTDRGLRMADNEDGVLERPQVPLFVVADGTGGTAPARVCLEVLGRSAELLASHGAQVAAHPDTAARLAVGRHFEEVFAAAGRAIREEAATRAAAEAAVAVAATVMGPFAFVAHVGNARAYLWRQGRLRCLTVDHTLAQQQLRRGEITAKEFATSPYRKTLTQALGATPSVHPDIAEVQLASGDVFLLCSDGLHRAIPEREIARTLAEHERLADAARRLVEAANGAGGKDNISLSLFRIGSGPDEAPAGKAVDVARALGQVFLFKGLSDAERLHVAPYFEQATYEAGATLCVEGELGDSFFLVVSGKVDVTHGQAKLIGLGPGDYAGEIALAREGPRTASLTARKRTQVLILTRARFLELIRRRPRLGARLVMPLLANVGDRIVDLRARLGAVQAVISGGEGDAAL